MPPRKDRPVERPAPRRPDRDHVRRLVDAIARQGAWDWDPITRAGTRRLRTEWDELAALVDIPDGRPSEFIYIPRLGTVDDVDGLTDGLMAEWDERAGRPLPA